ncbi:hypothetical protein CASFOL_003393 [Castilleja foliolosa]|uniref:Uncharacterized protein n=1 Tax=Castilleja foliolosa TaxID=1961234 RepID=A0ABD3EHK5_9LAMI
MLATAGVGEIGGVAIDRGWKEGVLAGRRVAAITGELGCDGWMTSLGGGWLRGRGERLASMLRLICGQAAVAGSPALSNKVGLPNVFNPDPQFILRLSLNISPSRLDNWC